jgi:hypothetical protein
MENRDNIIKKIKAKLGRNKEKRKKIEDLKNKKRMGRLIVNPDKKPLPPDLKKKAAFDYEGPISEEEQQILYKRASQPTYIDGKNPRYTKWYYKNQLRKIKKGII